MGRLDYLGMIPEAGIIFDGSNSIYYLAEGDYENAALAGLSAVPIVGEFATGERIVTRSKDNAEGLYSLRLKRYFLIIRN